MDRDDTSSLPRPLHFLWAGGLAIGFLCLVVLVLPEPNAVSWLPSDERVIPRQNVLILVIDSTELVDAHGAHVQSVLRQYCAACDVRHINVHGNMSADRLQLALGQALEIARERDEKTSLILNLSWGTYTYRSGMHDAIRKLVEADAVIVASAGNDNTDKPFYPAAFEEVLGVCSTSRYRKTKAAYSNFGPWVSLCAPGLHYVSRPLEHGGIASGTSFASPMVSGVLGQRLLAAPCATVEQGRQALLRTADVVSGSTEGIVLDQLNEAAAAHYLEALYGCGKQSSWGAKILTFFRQVSSNALWSVGLLVYAVVSIFAFPFLFAYTLERLHRRAEKRLNTSVQMAYTEPASYRSRRLDELQQRFRKRGRFRYRETAELTALLHAQYLFDETCGWCNGQQLILSEPKSVLDPQGEDWQVCARCGLNPEVSTLSFEG